MFYEELEAKIRLTPAEEHVFLLEDLNARLGADYEPWSCSLGHFSVDKLNENGQGFLELCPCYDLCVTNTVSTECHGDATGTS